MSWRWRSFERRMGSRVKPYDARWAMSFWRKLGYYLNVPVTPTFWFVRAVIGLCLVGVVLGNAASVVTHPEAWMAGVGWWGLLGAFTLGLPDSPVSSHRGTTPVVFEQGGLWILPLSADAIFQHHCRRRALRAAWGFVEFLLLYGLVAGRVVDTPSTWIGALMGALAQTGLGFGLSFLIQACRLSRAAPAVALGGAVYTALALLADTKPELGLLLAKDCNLLNPMGWVSNAFLDGWLSTSRECACSRWRPPAGRP